MVCCHAEIDWYESFPPRACWSFLHGPFFFFFFFGGGGGGGGRGVVLILSVNQSAVSLGWFGAMVMYI